MTAIALTKPQRSVLDEAPENLRAFVGALADRVAGGANWMVRKKTLCDDMLSLGAYLSLTPAERLDLAGSRGVDLPPDEGGDLPATFGEVLPLYIGAILERLAEERIASAEQAAVYVLSIHPEHQAAAEAWMTADPRNAKAVRKVARGDRRFASLLKTARLSGMGGRALGDG